MPWSELERRLSNGRPPGSPSWNAGGDSPAWSRKRQPYEAVVARQPGAVPYAELHCHSNFSFLDGASHPEELAEEARPARSRGAGPHRPRRLLRRGALRRGGPGRRAAHRVRRRAHPRRHPPPERRARPRGPPPGGPGRADRRATPAGRRHQPGPDGRGEGRAPLPPRRAGRAPAGHWVVLTGCRKGPVPAALVAEGPAAAARQLHRLIAAFGRDHVLVELWDHGDPLDSARNDALAELAGTPPTCGCVATNNVHYATPGRAPAGHRPGRGAGPPQPRRARRVAARPPPAPTCARGRADPPLRPLPRRGGGGGRAGPGLRLRPVAGGAEPAAVPVPRRARRDGLPPPARRRGRPAPLRPPGRQPTRGVDGRSTTSSTSSSASASPATSSSCGTSSSSAAQANIFCQGRGSAANSAVCYALGITNADAVAPRPAVRAVPVPRARRPARHRPRHRERPAGGGHPVRLRALRARRTAQVANVITYRAKSAVRDMAKALGFAPGQQDAWSKQVDAWGRVAVTAAQPDHDIPARGAGPGRAGRGLPPPPRHPLGRHGDLRPAGGRGVPGRVGPHGGPQRPAVGQGRLRRRRAW